MPAEAVPVDSAPEVVRSSARSTLGTRRRRLLVTGCGRSGTKYTSFVLRRLGLDVPHERLGADGLSSWCLAVEAGSVPWGPPGTGLAFDHVFHQIRHPLAVIASCATFTESSWSFIREHVPLRAGESPLVQGARYWYHWNLHAETISTWRYRVEELPRVFERFCAILGVASDPRALEQVTTDVNTRRRGRALHLYEELSERLGIDQRRFLRDRLGRAEVNRAAVSWELLAHLEPELCAAVQQKAYEYGYSPDEPAVTA